MTEISLVQEIITQLISPVLLAMGAGLIAYIRKIQKIHNDLCQKVEMLQKTIIVLAKTIDTQTKLNHPENITELDDLVRELLRKD